VSGWRWGEEVLGQGFRIVFVGDLSNVKLYRGMLYRIVRSRCGLFARQKEPYELFVCFPQSTHKTPIVDKFAQELQLGCGLASICGGGTVWLKMKIILHDGA
jgi:hypothetical protein